ncbi:MAG: hypothetical protein AB7U82_23355 [Blastocatellales bacterium]
MLFLITNHFDSDLTVEPAQAQTSPLIGGNARSIFGLKEGVEHTETTKQPQTSRIFRQFRSFRLSTFSPGVRWNGAFSGNDKNVILGA